MSASTDEHCIEDRSAPASSPACLAFAASCSTTRAGSRPAAGDLLASQAGGATDDPAAGFENTRPGSRGGLHPLRRPPHLFHRRLRRTRRDGQGDVDNQVAFLKKYPRWFAKLQGFADDPGGNAKMVQLSQQRADAVMNYLISSGIAPGRLWAKGYGKERVVRECTERACKVQNRRVITNLRTIARRAGRRRCKPSSASAMQTGTRLRARSASFRSRAGNKTATLLVFRPRITTLGRMSGLSRRHALLRRGAAGRVPALRVSASARAAGGGRALPRAPWPRGRATTSRRTI